MRVSPISFQRDRTGARSLLHSGTFSWSLRNDPFSQWRPDVLIVESIPYAHLYLMRKWVRKLEALKLLDVNEAWSVYRYGPRLLSTPSRTIIKTCLSSGLSWSNVVISVSHATETSLHQNYRHPLERIKVIPLGVDIDEIEAICRGVGGAKTYDFAFLGRLVTMKHPGDFIEALHLLSARFGWAGRAVVIGDGPLRASLSERIRRLNLSDKIHMVGFLPDKEKLSLLASSRIYVLCSEREGFSLSSLEAMACGMPVIAARPTSQEVAGPADFLSENLNGVYFDQRDVAQLAEVMRSLLLDEDRSKTMGENARRTAMSFDWKTVSGQLESIITTALDQRSADRAAGAVDWARS